MIAPRWGTIERFNRRHSFRIRDKPRRRMVSLTP